MQNLKHAFTANALFSGMSACTALVLAPDVSAWMGISNPWIVRVVGIGLLFFCLGLIRLVRSAKPSIFLVRWVIGLDLLWVLGSMVLLTFPPTAFSEGGEVLIALLACCVGFLASWQTSAIWNR